jgi:hypothetical protein
MSDKMQQLAHLLFETALDIVQKEDEAAAAQAAEAEQPAKPTEGQPENKQ